MALISSYWWCRFIIGAIGLLLLLTGSVHSQQSPTTCTLPYDRGFCKGHFPMFFYNANSKKCESFVWGGCQGNANRFNTFEACQTSCSNNALTKNNAAISTNRYQSKSLFNCSNFSIGSCNETKNSAESYLLVTPYLQIFLNLQAQINGSIESIQFIDKTPTAGKKFYLTVWKIDGLGSAWFNASLDQSKIKLTLMNVRLVTSTGQQGWQKFAFENMPAIESGQYIGIHQSSVNAFTANCTVPYATSSPTMPTVTVAVDHSVFQPLLVSNSLPATIDLSAKKWTYYIDKRRPALTATLVKS